MKKTGAMIFSSDHPLTQVCKEMKATLHDGKSGYDVFLELEIRARPGAKRDEILLKEGVLYMATHARAIEGEANSAITKSLAKFLAIAPTHGLLMRGEKSKNKTFWIGLNEKARNDPRKVAQVLLTLIVKGNTSG